MTWPFHSSESLHEMREPSSVFRGKRCLNFSSLQKDTHVHWTHVLPTEYSTWPTYGPWTHGMWEQIGTSVFISRECNIGCITIANSDGLVLTAFRSLTKSWWDLQGNLVNDRGWVAQVPPIYTTISNPNPAPPHTLRIRKPKLLPSPLVKRNPDKDPSSGAL